MGVEDKSVDVINLGEVTGSQKSGDTITVSYRNENGKNNTRTLSASSMKYIYNGMYEANPTAALFLADGGEARIINNDTVIITAYKTVVVYGVNLDSETIYDKYKKYDNSLLLQDSDYSFVNEDGVNIPLEAIVKDNVISVAKSKDGKMVRGIVSSRLVTSKVEAVENEGSTDMKVTAGGMEYKVKNQIDDWTKWLKAGTEGTFYIDVFGNIVGFTANAKEDIPGYILTVAEGGSGLRKKLQAAIMVKSDEDYVVYDFADKVIIDGEKYTKNDDIAKQFRRDFDDSKTITSEFKPQGIIFTLNDENRITKVDTFHVGTNENPKTTLNRRWGFEDKNPEGSTYAYPRHKGGSLGGKFHINMDEHLSVMRTKDTNPALEDYKSVTKGVRDDGKMAFEIYTIGPNFPEPVVFAFAGEINNTVPSTSRLMIVDRVVTAFDEDGMEVQRMYYYDGDKRSSVDAAYEAAAEMTDVKRGDIVRFGTDADGKLLCLDTHYDSATHAITTTGYFSAASRVYGGYTLAVEGKYVKVSTSTTESEDYSWVNSDKFASFFYKYEANSAGIEVTKATLADIRPFDQVPFETTGMVLCAGYENLRKNVYLVELGEVDGTGMYTLTYQTGKDGVTGGNKLPQGAQRVNPDGSIALEAYPDYLRLDQHKVDETNPWLIDKTPYEAGATYTAAKNVVVTPNWVPAETVTITLKAGEGTGADVVIKGQVKGRDYKTEIEETFTCSGKTLYGWKNEADNSFYATGASVPNVQTDITLTAQWGNFTPWNGKAPTEDDKPSVGDGSAGNPYQISNGNELAWFAKHVNGGNASANAILTGDIYLNGFFEQDAITFDEDWYETKTSDKNWFSYAIGRDTAYAGTFDGDGNTIYGLYTTANSDEIGGLFGKITGGTVKNLNIKGAYVVSSSESGKASGGKASVLAAIVSGATIDTVTVGGKITTKDNTCSSHIAGSIVAYVDTGDTITTIKDCTSDVDIDLSNSTAIATAPTGTSESGVGGIVGAAKAGTRYMVEITGCTNNGDINAPMAYRAAGILAWTAANTYLTNFKGNTNNGDIYGGTNFSGKLIAAEKAVDASTKYTGDNTAGGTANKSN